MIIEIVATDTFVSVSVTPARIEKFSLPMISTFTNQSNAECSFLLIPTADKDIPSFNWMFPRTFLVLDLLNKCHLRQDCLYKEERKKFLLLRSISVC